MHFNTLSISLSHKLAENCNERNAKYYNNPHHHTNKTIKKPFSCPANHGTCNVCHLGKKFTKRTCKKTSKNVNYAIESAYDEINGQFDDPNEWIL